MIKLDRIELQMLRDLVQGRLQEIEVSRALKNKKDGIEFYDPAKATKQEEFDLRMLLHKLEIALND